ncbi:Uncharacterized protein APZ42_012661 [Daphnia magna]|uniref:Uncharacterized protein n=1 Tax=Daphnia magna TaxID=35525 RepID=A0A162RKW4_9CRUS|nr:Uncharacterized protein APZ42_012661 [Daphnia magna]
MRFHVAVLLATVLVVLDAAPYKRQYYPQRAGYYPTSAYYGPAGFSADDYYSAPYSGYPSYYSGYNRNQQYNSRPSSYRYPSSFGYQSAYPNGFGWPRWSSFPRFVATPQSKPTAAGVIAVVAPNVADEGLKAQQPVVLVLDHDEDDLQQQQQQQEEEEFDLSKLVGNFVPDVNHQQQQPQDEEQPELQEPATQDGFLGAVAQAQFAAQSEADFDQPELSPLVVPSGMSFESQEAVAAEQVVQHDQPAPMAAVEPVVEAQVQPIAVVAEPVQVAELAEPVSAIADQVGQSTKVEEPVEAQAVDEPVQVAQTAFQVGETAQVAEPLAESDIVQAADAGTIVVPLISADANQPEAVVEFVPVDPVSDIEQQIVAVAEPAVEAEPVPETPVVADVVHVDPLPVAEAEQKPEEDAGVPVAAVQEAAPETPVVADIVQVDPLPVAEAEQKPQEDAGVPVAEPAQVAVQVPVAADEEQVVELSPVVQVEPLAVAEVEQKPVEDVVPVAAVQEAAPETPVVADVVQVDPLPVAEVEQKPEEDVVPVAAVQEAVQEAVPETPVVADVVQVDPLPVAEAEQKPQEDAGVPVAVEEAKPVGQQEIWVHVSPAGQSTQEQDAVQLASRPFPATPTFQKPEVWIESDVAAPSQVDQQDTVLAVLEAGQPAKVGTPVQVALNADNSNEQDNSAENASTEKAETVTESNEDNSLEKMQVELVQSAEPVPLPQADSQVKDPVEQQQQQPLIYREEIVVSSGSLAVGHQGDAQVSLKPAAVIAIPDRVTAAQVEEEAGQVQAVESDQKVEKPVAEDLKIEEPVVAEQEKTELRLHHQLGGKHDSDLTSILFAKGINKHKGPGCLSGASIRHHPNMATFYGLRARV